MILPSSRGHDGSELRLPANFGIASSEVDDVSTLLDAEGTARVHLIGHSTGGAVGFAFAQQFPERVDRMVLIEPTLLALLPAQKFAEISEAYAGIIEISEAQGDVAAIRAVMELLGGDAWLELDEAVRATRLNALAPMAPLVAPTTQALLDFAVDEADVRTLAPPTLWIYGDQSFDIEAPISERIRALRPDLPQLLVKGAGHNSHRERAEQVTEAIVEFLAT